MTKLTAQEMTIRIDILDIYQKGKELRMEMDHNGTCLHEEKVVIQWDKWCEYFNIDMMIEPEYRGRDFSFMLYDNTREISNRLTLHIPTLEEFRRGKTKKHITSMQVAPESLRYFTHEGGKTMIIQWDAPMYTYFEKIEYRIWRDDLGNYEDTIDELPYRVPRETFENIKTLQVVAVVHFNENSMGKSIEEAPSRLKKKKKKNNRKQKTSIKRKKSESYLAYVDGILRRIYQGERGSEFYVRPTVTKNYITNFARSRVRKVQKDTTSHAISDHQSDITESQPQQRQYRYQCSICFKVFSNGMALGGHTKWHNSNGHSKVAPNATAHSDADEVQTASQNSVSSSMVSTNVDTLSNEPTTELTDEPIEVPDVEEVVLDLDGNYGNYRNSIDSGCSPSELRDAIPNGNESNGAHGASGFDEEHNQQISTQDMESTVEAIIDAAFDGNCPSVSLFILLSSGPFLSFSDFVCIAFMFDCTR